MIWKSESNSIEKDQFKPKENILLAVKIYFKVKFSIGDKKDYDLLIKEIIHQADLVLVN